MNRTVLVLFPLWCVCVYVACVGVCMCVSMYVLPGNTKPPVQYGVMLLYCSVCRAMAALEQTMKLLDTKRVTSILRNVLQFSDLMFSNMCVAP